MTYLLKNFNKPFNKPTLALILSIIIAYSSFASTGVIIGKVTDAASGYPLIGASIIIEGTKTGTTADLDGSYELTNIPVGSYKIKASYIGHKDSIVQVTVEEGKTVKANFKLDGAEGLNEIVVLGSRRAKAFSVSRVFGKKKRRNINIKGNRSDATAYYIDGAQVRGKNKDFNTEGYDEIKENPFFNVTNEPLSTFSIDVDAASYANVRRMINQGKKPIASAVRIEEMINYFNYNYPEPENTDPFSVITELAQCPWNDKHQLMHIGLQGKKIDASNLPPSNLVFLIDVSGSMNDYSKLPLLVESFKLLVNKLRPQDKVAIVVYAGSSGLVLPSTLGSDKETIVQALESLNAGGSTAGGAGIVLAYKVARENYIEDGNNRVILATDGDFNIGVSSDGELVKLIEQKREEGVFLSVLGFGMGNYQDAKMQKLANKGNGNHYYIDGIMEAKKVLVNEFGGTLFTIAKDVKLQLEFNPTKVAAYRLIGYENRMLENQDFKDDNKDAGELGAGHTVTALYEIIPVGVESDYLVKAEKLKYQKNKNITTTTSTELLTVKLRYKKPDENKSQLIEIPVEANSFTIENTSKAFQFAAGVAQFGLLLRNSTYKHKAEYENTISLIQNNLGDDPYGYRAEFLSLIKKVKNM